MFYPASALSGIYRRVLFLNPLTLIIEDTRALLFFGRMPDLVVLTIYWVAAFVFSWLGFAWFQKTRRGFADVL